MTFFICSCNNDVKYESFILKEPLNSLKGRNFKELPVHDKLDLNKIDLFYVLKLETDKEKLFFQNGDGLEIFVLNKGNLDLSEVRKITFSKGKGPGELLSITDYDVFDDKIYISDRQQGKISIFGLNGNLYEEFIVPAVLIDRLQVVDHDRILTFSLKSGEHAFNIVNTSGEVMDSFVKTEADLHYLMYSGDIHYNDKSLYFVGYSEPILKKYDLQNKNLIYSVNTIKDYSTEGNYVIFESGTYSSSSYTSAALYNSLGYTVYNNSLYMTRHHNGEFGSKYLDIYGSNTGEYMLSHKLEHYPRGYGVVIDDHHIYSLEQSEGDKEWLVVYNRK